MALSKPMQLADNFQRLIDFTSVYIKVVTVSGDKTHIRASIEYRDGVDGIPLENRNVSFSLDLNGANPIKQAYEYLKTLPEFADAVDC